MSKLKVATNQTVKKGDVIGYVSNDFGGTPGAARVRDWAGRVARRPALRDALFGAVYAAAAWALALPLTAAGVLGAVGEVGEFAGCRAAGASGTAFDGVACSVVGP